MTTYERRTDPGQPAEEISTSVYILLAAILLIVCSVGLYAYPRDHQMIVTATNAIERFDAISRAEAEPAR